MKRAFILILTVFTLLSTASTYAMEPCPPNWYEVFVRA